MTHFSPREIVSELDRFIVGQGDAKRAVAIALRNRWRRQQLTGSMRDEVMPKNILMIGPQVLGLVFDLESLLHDMNYNNFVLQFFHQM